jgi:20S proteasome alpha/beta subunit
MTLIVCLRGKDGMVLASDSRGTFGDPRGVTAQNDNMQKVYPVSKYVGVLLAGSGELGAMVINEIQKEIGTRRTEGVTPVMGLIREILIKKFDEWFKGFLIQPVQGSTSPVRPNLVLIAGGYDLNGEGKPTIQRIYHLNCFVNFAPFLIDYGFALEGLPQYALYLLNRLYNPDSSVKNLLPLAAYVITETASQDGKVGGPVQMIKILPDAGCVTLNSEEINKIIESNNDRSKNLKTSFFGSAENVPSKS